MRILVVDDNTPLREVIADTIGIYGHDVESTDSAERALELITSSKARFHLVITDMRLPGMSGLELCARVKEHTPDCFRIIISGSFDKEDVRLPENDPDIAFLGKPFSLASLAHHIQTVSRKVGAQGQQ